MRVNYSSTKTSKALLKTSSWIASGVRRVSNVPSGAQSVNEWIRQHHESVTGVDGYSSEYKKDITFNLLSPNGEKVEQWILKGAFITEANFNDLDFASNDVVDIALISSLTTYWIAL